MKEFKKILKNLHTERKFIGWAGKIAWEMYYFFFCHNLVPFHYRTEIVWEIVGYLC